VDHFFAHVVGESFRNDDGSDRQTITPRCRVGDLLVLEPEPDNPRDINAIRVLRRNGEQIGLEREFAGQVVSRTAKGSGFHALVAGVGRGKSGLYGMALLIVVENDGASDEEVAAYGRRVLARDREVEASDTGAAPGRRAGRQSASGDRLVLVIAIAIIGLAIAVALTLLR
jgi:hypothetical protein